MAEPEQSPLSGRSLPELRELLRRQERLLGDWALVSRLPDGGERVRECAARLRAAVAAREERRRRSGPGPGPTEPPPRRWAASPWGRREGPRREAGAGPARGPAEPPGGGAAPRGRDGRAAAPLRHAPARLLPLAESVALQLRQEEARQEMQAKVAAQKLAERLGIKMVPYEPEGKMMTSYREVRDEEGDSSAED